MKCIGVTGTNGKSTTATWLAHALATRAPTFLVTTLGGSIVTADGLARSYPMGEGYDGFVDAARAASSHCPWGVIECTSEALAQGFAQRFGLQGGVFTNLTRDHYDSHGSREHYVASKAQLFANLRPPSFAVLNAADLASADFLAVLPEGTLACGYAVPERGPCLPFSGEVWRSGQARSLGTYGSRAYVGNGQSRLIELWCGAIGAHFLENALAAFLGAVMAGIDPDEARAAIGRAPAPAGRLERVRGLPPHAPTVLVDYAHTPDAITRTIAAVRAHYGPMAQARHPPTPTAVWIVFGAGGDRDRGKRPQMGAAACAADFVVLTTDNPRSEDPVAIIADIEQGIVGGPSLQQVHTRIDRQQAIALALGRAAPTDVVILAGKGHENDGMSDHDRARAVFEAR